jgi:nitrogen-specific signal transduction histidine kinase
MMAAERDEQNLANAWGELVGVVNGLSPDEQNQFRRIFRTFTHDLREACGQIQAAAQLLRRLPVEPEQAADRLELMEVIHTANNRASELLAALTHDFIDHIETEGGELDAPLP